MAIKGAVLSACSHCQDAKESLCVRKRNDVSRMSCLRALTRTERPLSPERTSELSAEMAC